MQLITNDNLEQRIAEISSGVHDIHDYIRLRILLACRQERDKDWYAPGIKDGIDEEKLYRQFKHVKLILRRVEFGIGDAPVQDMIKYITEKKISPYLLYDLIHVNFRDEAEMQTRFGGAFFQFCEDERYREEFMEHARRVEFYDIEL